jgi:hypothetical protein
MHVFAIASTVCTTRFINKEDIAWFEKTILRVLQEEFSDNLATYIEVEYYFQDFLR